MSDGAAFFYYTNNVDYPPPSRPPVSAPIAKPAAATATATATSSPPKKPKSKKSTHFSKTSARPKTPNAVLPPLPQQLDEKELPPTPSQLSSSQDHMLSTPLPDYKHSANQTAKTRRDLEATRHAQRKSSSTATTSSAERRHAAAAAAALAKATAPHELSRSDSKTSSATNSSGLTAITTNDASRRSDDFFLKPFATRDGRRYLRDTSLPYPLPVDLGEIHRQTLRTVLLSQVFKGPFCSPSLAAKPPKKVLEIACGTGLWSVLCHRHFSQRGITNINFTGLDIAPLSRGLGEGEDMNWRFVQHDLRKLPLPFKDEEFGFVMIKDCSLVMETEQNQALMDEYIRILKPGGTLEIWDGDHTLRMLAPHVRGEDDEDKKLVDKMGVYTITPATPFAAPQNTFLNDFNVWMAKALEKRRLSAMPCTSMSPLLLQEAEVLTEIDSCRLAIPLGEVRWEREGVGVGVAPATVVTKGKGKDGVVEKKKSLTEGQRALRRTALMTVTQMIESLEPVLRESSGKGQDEWDRWVGGMMNDLLKGGGTTFGECLEVGAWWARKKKAAG